MRQISLRISWLLACILASVIALCTVPGAALAAEVPYVDVGGGSASAEAVEVTAEMTSWGDSGDEQHWYVAQGDVTIGSRVTVTGDVHLILADNATLTVNGGIGVSGGNSLTIYGQKNGTGELAATAGGKDAGIGSNQSSKSPGTITINGGTVIANGGDGGGGNGGAGIGSGLWGSVGDITINGGTVTARGGWDAAGIGNGTFGSCGVITISGGVVTATGQNSGFGIGADRSGAASTFSTGENGNAVIIANGISDQSRKSSWSGAIFEGASGQVYAPEGDKIAVPQNWSVPKDCTLTVPWGVTLEIPAGTRLDVEGTLVNEGAIEVAGTLDWGGDEAKFTNNGVVTTLDGGLVSPTAPVFKNELTVTGGEEGADYDFRGAVLIILKGTPLTVTGAADGERIVVNSGVDANLTLDGVSINIESAYNAIDLLDGASLNLTLAGENALKPGGGKAGIHVPGGTSLVIDGPGSLSVDGGRAGAAAAGGAGIGADNGGDLGNITINGGTVVAQSTNGGSAGIGEGGWRNPAITPGSSVTINGGNVTASAVSGSGEGSICAEKVAITGSIVEVSDDKLDGADVSKSNCIVFKNKVGKIYTSSDNTISIAQDWEIPSGYTLTVPWYVTLEIPAGTRLDVEGTLVNEGAIEVAGTLDWGGDGASFTNDGVVTTSEEGKVTPDVPAFKNNLAVSGGVEGTDYDVRGAVTVIWSDTPLTVTGASNAERIIIDSGVSANLTLDGVTIDIESAYNAIDLLDGASLNLTLAGENALKPGGGKAGIHVPGGTSLVIDGPGSLSVDGGRAGAAAAGGAGIGADNGGDLGNITINGGTVVAQSTNGGSAGIGEGGWRNPAITPGSSVTINGGHVTASAADRSGEGSINAETVAIIGGYVTVSSIPENGGSINATTVDITGGIVEVSDDKLDGANVTKKNCIVFKNKVGQIYTSNDETVSIAQDWEMPSGYMLTVPSDVTLIVPEGVSLEIAGYLTWTGAKIENYGTIKLAEGGSIDPALLSVTVSDVAVDEGAEAIFAATVSSVGAGDAPADVAYRWQTEGESGTWADIEDATGTQYALGNVGTGQDGARYRCVVTLNGYTAYSAPATLTVLKPVDQCYTIDFAAETITTVDGYEIYTAETGGDKVENGGSIASYIGKTLYIQKSGSTALGRREISIPARPAAPEFAIDNVAEGVEIPNGHLYSADGGSGTWAQGDGSLVKVEPEASISICQAATDSAFRSEVKTHTAPARAAEPADVAIDYENESLSGADAGMEYAVDGGTWTACTVGMAMEELGWDGDALTVRFRTAATDANYASEPVSLDIPAQPAAPDAPTLQDSTDCSITIATTQGVQYRLGTDDDWQVSDTGSLTFDNLSAKTTYTVYFRTPASDDRFASAEDTVEFATKSGASAALEVTYEVTADSVALQYDAAWEYSTDQQNWSSIYEFTGLTPATQYTYYVRVAETETAEASQVATVTVWTAHAVPAAGEGYAIDYAAETATAQDGYQVRLSDGDEWATGPVSIAPGGTFQVRHAVDEGGAPASEATVAIVPSRPVAPELTIDNAAEGVTVPVGYLYSADGAGDPGAWTSGDGSLVTVAPQGSICICQAATDGAFRSEVQTLTAPARGAAPSTPSIDYENESLSGTAAGMEFSVDGEAWTACAEDMALEELGWDGGAVTVRFRTAATDEGYASGPVTLDIPARPAAPSAPAVADRTDASITIEAAADVQYRLGEGGEWTASDTGSLTFEGLDAGKAYTVYARIPATADRFASAEAAIQVTTKSGAAAAPEVGAPAVTDTSVALPYDSAWEYSSDQQNWSGTHEFTGLSPATQYTYYVRAAETEAAEASQVATVTVWTAYAAPTGVQGGAGQITGVTADMEYSGDGGATWTTCPDGSVTGLSAGEYLVRRMASGDIPASSPVTVTVTSSYPPYVPPAQTGPDWEDVIDDIDDAADGERVVVDMGDKTELPGEVLEELAGSDVTLVIDMGGGVSWEIDGADIPEGTSFTAVNLGVEMGTDGIPVEVTNLVTGESSVVQVTLAHDGPFGFELTLVAPLGAENEGLVANLYCYDEAEGVLRFESFGTIDENGTARLRLDHASEWAIALDTRGHALPFPDAVEDQWYAESVRWAWLHGVMTGYADGSGRFGTNDSLTRAQMAAVLYNVAGQPDMDVSGLPADCDGGAWYVQPVAWTLENSIFHGYNDDAFGPDDIISREQAACVLYNRALAAGEDVSAKADVTGFSDAEELSAWAYDAMSWAVAEGVFIGTDAGELQPGRALTRAEGAAILCNWENRS